MTEEERKAAFKILADKGLGLGHAFPRDTMLYKEPNPGSRRRTVTPLMTLSPLESYLVSNLMLETACKDMEQADFDKLIELNGGSNGGAIVGQKADAD